MGRRKTVKDRKWIKKADLLLALVLLAICIPIILYKPASESPVAVVTVKGEETERIDLSKVKRPYKIRLECKPAAVLTVKPGEIRFSEADCHDKLCVNTGWLSKPGDMAACLPSGTVVRIEGGKSSSDKPDAITW